MASSSDQNHLTIIAIVIAAVSLLTSIATVVIIMCIMFLRKCRHCAVGGAAETGNQMEMKRNVAYVTTTMDNSTPQDTTYETMN